MLPLPLWHTASVGIELWLSAVAYGASQVWVLMTDEEAPQYHTAVQAQMEVAQAILTGLGYSGQHFRILQARDARDTQRSVAPLKPADDAITLDTTRLTIPEVVDRLIELLAQRGLAPNA